MRWLVIPFLLLPSLASAEQAAPPPEMQALQSVAMEAIQARLNWQTQAIALQAQVADAKAQDEQHKAAAEAAATAAQAQVADLQKQLADAKKDKAP